MKSNGTTAKTQWFRPWLSAVVVLALTAGIRATVEGQTQSERADSTPPIDRTRGGFGAGFAGRLPDFVVQVPDTKSEVTGEMVSKLGLSWMRDWLKDTPYEGDEPPVPPPLLPNDKTSRDIWFVGRLGFTPIGTIAGLAHGGLTGESAKKIDRALPSITNVMAELQMPGRFEPLLLGLLEEKWPGAILLTNPLPHESTFPDRKLINDVVPMPKGWEGVREDRVESGAFRGASAAVVLRVVSWGLLGRAQRNPLLSVNLTVKATVVNLRDRVRGEEYYATYESEGKRFVEWGQEGGRVLREELRRGVQHIADEIARQVPVPSPDPTILTGGHPF